MQLNEFYASRINTYTNFYNDLKRFDNRLSMGRLTLFILSLVLFYIFFAVSVLLAVTLLLMGLFALGWLVKYQNGIIKKKTHYQHLISINKAELSSLEGNYTSFADGAAYTDREHPYAYDLDIFGRASLFQFINRTISKPASDLLAGWLKRPASISEINLRQPAVSELKEMTDWRQQLMALGYQYKDAANNPDTITNWINNPYAFLEKKYLRPLIVILSILTVIVAIFVLQGLPSSLLLLMVMVNFAVNYKYLKTINVLHQQVSKNYEMLQSYSEAICLIEQHDFKSEKLRSLLAMLKGSGSASEQIKKLSVIVNRLDTRFNIMVAVPLNVFFFWDIHYCFLLEKWKAKNSSFVGLWFSAMAEVEALSSLSNISFNNPAWCLPVVTSEYFKLHAENFGHPLIPAERRVVNNFNINGSGKIVLVTGSNMSGKSTFQRTCGVNMVLAFAGAPVCASSFEVSHVSILTSMRISDSLEDNTSSFYAELKRLAMIIHEAETNPHVFMLLDEILRGTNSNDRHIGSEALIKQLIQQKSAGIVATHDLSLSELENELPNNIDNYNFDVKISGEELYFDYKLNHGICKSLNASILMKKMGIKM